MYLVGLLKTCLAIPIALEKLLLPCSSVTSSPHLHQPLNVLHVVKGPELSIAIEVWPDQCLVQHIPHLHQSRGGFGHYGLPSISTNSVRGQQDTSPDLVPSVHPECSVLIPRCSLLTAVASLSLS